MGHGDGVFGVMDVRPGLPRLGLAPSVSHWVSRP
jgi:hypothetical protein